MSSLDYIELNMNNNIYLSFTIISNDNKHFNIPLHAIEHSFLLNTIYEETKDTEIQINIDGVVLEKVFEFLNYHISKDTWSIMSKPISNTLRLSGMSEWDEKFISSLSTEELTSTLNAANYLHIQNLIDIGCCYIAFLFKTQPIEELSVRFNMGPLNDEQLSLLKSIQE